MVFYWTNFSFKVLKVKFGFANCILVFIKNIEDWVLMTYYSLLLPLQQLSCSLHFESLSSSTLLLFHNVGPDAFCRRSNFWLPLPGNCGYHSPGFHLHGDCTLLFPFSCNMCRTFLVQKSIAGTKIVPSQMNEKTFPMPKKLPDFFH